MAPSALQEPKAFTGSDLLGGTLAINDLARPAAHPMAQAERARALRIGDPFAPLPLPFQQPMRLALSNLQQQSSAPRRIDPARLVNLPSPLVQRPVAVPVVLQSDGSVDVLSKPEDGKVMEHIRDWSSRQAAPEPGSVEPAVVVVEPLPAAATESTQAPSGDRLTGIVEAQTTDSITGEPL